MSEEAIRHTLASYCQLLDDGKFDEWIQVFTPDVRFGVMGQVFEGHDAVRGFIEPAQQADARGRHMISEPMISIDGDSAAVTTDYCFVGQDLTVTSAGRYHDRLVRDGDTWLIAEREIVFLGEQQEGF